MEVEGTVAYALDTGEFSVSIKKGERKSLPTHIALALERNGIVSLNDVTSVDVRKRLMNERANKTLVELPEDYLELLCYRISQLGGNEKSKLLAAGKELIKVRLEKLQLICLQGKSPPNSMQDMERAFFTKTELLIQEALDLIEPKKENKDER